MWVSLLLGFNHYVLKQYTYEKWDPLEFRSILIDWLIDYNSVSTRAGFSLEILFFVYLYVSYFNLEFSILQRRRWFLLCSG